MLDILKLYHNYDVYYVTEGHKHARQGWVNVECPFCEGNPGYHLGFNITGQYFSCYRCGGHSLLKVLSKLLNYSTPETAKIIKDYETRAVIANKTIKLNKSTFQLPTNLIPLTETHQKYLKQRNFDPAELTAKYNIQSTSPISQVAGVNYQNRIFIPVYWNNEIVSFQTRIHLKHVEPRYLSCPKSVERIEHKDILYGTPQPYGGTGFIVEGVTDVWRMGNNTFATFGTQWSKSQFKWICKMFDKVIILIEDAQAKKQMKKLEADLRFMGKRVFSIQLAQDPASMSDSEIKQLKKYFL